MMIDLPHTAVTDDSRQVGPGTLFVARGGTRTDGAKFAADAVRRGAVGVVSGSPINGLAVPNIVVDDAARTLGELAHALHGHPTRTVKTLAVTGTNGKTTTTYLVRHLLKHAGIKCGLIGTVEIDDGTNTIEAEMTTPGAPDVAAHLAAMRDNGCHAAVLEASSHALQQRRLAGCEIAGAAFLNLTGDHLDYHGTMDEYAAAKALVFESLDKSAVAAVNIDAPQAGRMLIACQGRPVPFSPKGDASVEWHATDVDISAAGTRFILHGPGGAHAVGMPLIGRHNVENALAAAVLVAETFGISVEQIAAGLSDATGAPGRLERVDDGGPITVLVDYAHTDDALDNVLRALRPLCKGKLRVAFGCGGDRDKTKRPRMAGVAEKWADAIYVTSDNPRTEDPQAILADITAGLARPATFIDADRRSTIHRIVADALPGDVVLIAGKGHENYQILGTTKHHFDDAEEARAALKSGR